VREGLAAPDLRAGMADAFEAHVKALLLEIEELQISEH
jgi:hypothetical protein